MDKDGKTVDCDWYLLSRLPKDEFQINSIVHCNM